MAKLLQLLHHVAMLFYFAVCTVGDKTGKTGEK